MQHPYASFVHEVQKPARYLGGEHGAVRKDWASVDARVCLAFPDLYDIGMSHLGFKILYKILNDDPRTLAERAYTPWIDMQDKLRERGLPLLSLESARPLRDFDVVGFSLQFELTYTNVLTMLDLGGIPLRSAARLESDPLVIAGGPTATHPEPLAPFMDAFVIGDGEERATEIALLWTSLRKKGVARSERLVALAQLRGVYVPSLYETSIDSDTGLQVVTTAKNGAPLPVMRNLVADLDKFPFPDDGPVGGPEAIFDRMSIEIARGCTEGCRFCQAGMIYRPVRERDPEAIVETLASAVKKSGYDEVSLTSLSTADFSCIAPLIQKVTERLAPERVSLGVSSLRAYGLEEAVLDDMQSVRASGITFAPEAGSQRMRDVVNKNVTEEQLMTTAERVFSRGWSSMKLYFMIGLPTEEEADVREIVRVGKRARDVGKRVKSAMGAQPPSVTVSVSTHVPKPHTPFQWCAMDASSEVNKKQAWLKEEQKGSRVDLRMHDSDGSWLEGVFARGDRAVADVLEAAYRAGARFDSWDEKLDVDLWRAAFERCGVEPARYLGTIPVSARLTWSHIDVGLEEGFLLAEYRKALRSRLSLPCGKAAGMFIHHTNVAEANDDARRLVCYDCGVACDMTQMGERRLVALRKLDAHERRPPRPKVIAKKKRNAPPASFEQGEARRYRFAYEKLGPSAFLSHLDLIRALPRSFRRVGLPLHYSRGFHPKPEMTFGPALSLGVFSAFEVVDIKLTCDVDPATVLDELSRASPEGLRFVRGARLEPKAPSISRVIDTLGYVVGIPSSIASTADVAARVEALLAKEEAKIMRRIDGVGKWVDVRKHLTVLEPCSTELLQNAGIGGDLSAFRAFVTVSGSGGVKIAEVVEAMFSAETPRVALRMAQGTTHNGAFVSALDSTDASSPIGE